MTKRRIIITVPENTIEILKHQGAEIEPAPPAGFKPKCRDEVIEYKSNDRDSPWVTVFKCEKCDIRDKCIYKRE